MDPSNKTHRKQTVLPLFPEEIVPVPTAQSRELEGALADLLLSVVKGSDGDNGERGGS